MSEKATHHCAPQTAISLAAGLGWTAALAILVMVLGRCGEALAQAVGAAPVFLLQLVLLVSLIRAAADGLVHGLLLLILIVTPTPIQPPIQEPATL